MKSDAWFDDKEGIVRMKIVGKISNSEYREVNRKLIDTISAEKRMRQIVDLTEAEAMNIDRKTRKEIAEEMYASEVEGTKLAIIGASPMTRMLTKVILAMRKLKSETRFFNSEVEALAWLKEEK